MNAGQLAQFSPFFFLGAVCFLFREKLVLWGSVCAVLIVLFVVSFKTPYVHLMGYVALPCLVLYLAFTDIPFLRNFGKYGDASYGMYVYAFPVQQTLIHYLGNQISVAAFFACSFFVTLLVSFLSWHIVEHPALGLKNVRLLPWRRVETDVVPEERVTQE
jgi:peptidoglycan/LPS O-acetylase OafA/YrhL